MKHRYQKTIVVLSAMLMLSGRVVAYDPKDSPIFDAHIHYSQDVWEAVPPEDAIRRLREAGIERAMVSSTSDEGTQMLYAVAPDLVIPVLRPYRKFGTTSSWMYDKTVIQYLEERLAKYRYVAIGEFHLDGAEADLPVVRAVVQLARQHKLMLHVHSDADAIERIFKHDPAAQIIWAHAGFEEGYVVNDLLDQYENLWVDLSFRHEIYTNGHFLPGWHQLLVDHAGRFMLAIDTYIPQRWLKVQSVMNWQRKFINALPADVAKRIAWENGERVITSRFRK